ncbi:hypothetical protein [Nocardia sp. CDC160]|uniref:hypothetical protein n=1 Tax=Nocardia sp. CDC160 TaxID=3112166 RepID=UPI002DBD6E73|nr:hypothetical protein [Nocardia sp. CDC160]MEC3920465.1 hypothetical protein [Nocardia sp. CDC160]
MRKALRASAIIGAAAACGMLCTQTASATVPVATPEPGGVIRMDLAPGESWNCGAWSLQPPFVTSDPLTGLASDRPLYLHLTPGANAWVFCEGTAAPFIYYGPIVKAGE